jgi:DNA-binding transcriptional regulator YiaG
MIMKENLFQPYELDALLGEYVDDFDVDGIIRDATEIDDDGDRIWTAFDEELTEILERHDLTARSKAEFRAMRESLGLTQQRLADLMGVRILSVKRWELPTYPQQAPGDAWRLLDSMMERQDEAIGEALKQVREIAGQMEGEPAAIALPYWSSQRDYDEHHHAEDEGTWTEANADSRRLASMLRWLGYKVRWVDGRDNPVPRAM